MTQQSRSLAAVTSRSYKKFQNLWF